MVTQIAHLFTRTLTVTALVVGVGACAGDDSDSDGGFVRGIEAAIDAVEADRGTGQQYFEVTANQQLTNVFVAVDEATAAVPYVYLDGELQPPAPQLDGASGFTFTADAVDFDADAILSQVAAEVPDATVESLSVEGGEGGTVRFVVAVRSPAGGELDVTVAPDGAVLAVDPV